MKKGQYISSLDFLRGLAALSVCIFHFTNGKKDFLPDGNFVKDAGSYGNYGVQVFFVISGLVIPYSMEKANYAIRFFKEFMLKRIIRIEPPYLLSICLILLLNYISTLSPYYRGGAVQIDFLNLLFHLGYINAFVDSKWLNPVYWTLAIEFQYYLIMACIFPLLVSSKKYLWIAVLLIFNCIGLLLKDPNLIFEYALYFSIGIVMFKFINGSINTGIYSVTIILLLISVFVQFKWPGLVAAIIPVLFIQFTIKNKLSVFLGSISYSLYLLHVPVGVRIINLSETFVTGIEEKMIVLVVALLITIFASWLFCKYVELPCKKWAKGIRYYKNEPVLNAV